MKTIEFCTNVEWLSDGYRADGMDGDEVADARLDAALAALAKDPRAVYLETERANGQRTMFHGWNGANTFRYKFGIFGTFSELDDEEKAALCDAEEAGRAAAQKASDEIDAERAACKADSADDWHAV